MMGQKGRTCAKGARCWISPALPSWRGRAQPSAGQGPPPACLARGRLLRPVEPSPAASALPCPAQPIDPGRPRQTPAGGRGGDGRQLRRRRLQLHRGPAGQGGSGGSRGGRRGGRRRSAALPGAPQSRYFGGGQKGFAKMALLKCGWLWRQSSILRRWKRNWFVLWADGSLIYYQDDTGREMDGRINIRSNCRDIRTGRECRDIQPPEGKTRECLMCVVQRDGPKTMLCAESEDDALAWKMAILEAKATQVHLYDPYDDYYQTVPLDSHQAMYVSSDYYGNPYVAPGTTHVIIREDPHRVSGDQMALGLLAGAATGAALGSFMWMPCWF